MQAVIRNQLKTREITNAWLKSRGEKEKYKGTGLKIVGTRQIQQNAGPFKNQLTL